MAILLRIAVVTLSLTAAACAGGGISPVGPSPVISSAPSPAPLSQTVTGTWYADERSFTVTDIGTGVTGMLRETIIEIGNGLTLTENADISGTVSGSSVTLNFAERVEVSGAGPTFSCTADYLFTGTLDGNRLSGMMTAGSTPLECERDLQTLSVPELSGPMTYTRQ